MICDGGGASWNLRLYRLISLLRYGPGGGRGRFTLTEALDAFCIAGVLGGGSSGDGEAEIVASL